MMSAPSIAAAQESEPAPTDLRALEILCRIANSVAEIAALTREQNNLLRQLVEKTLP
jgi:hypothetical protein